VCGDRDLIVPILSVFGALIAAELCTGSSGSFKRRVGNGLPDITAEGADCRLRSMVDLVASSLVKQVLVPRKIARMVGFVIDRSFGRKAFGADPASYHSARPPYPDWVFATLVERCGLADGKSVFEIGPGTGTATRRLLDLGARPLIAIEPDPGLAA
jgi:hypothetical protein